MGSGEGVVDIDVAERRHFLCEVHVTLFLTGEEAGVFQQDHAGWRQVGNRRLHMVAPAVSDKADIGAEHFGKGTGDGR